MEEYNLSLLENKVLGKICSSMWEEVTGDLRKFHEEKLHYLYSSNIISDHFKEGEMGKSCGTNGGKRNECKVVVLKPEIQKPFGRHRSRRDDNIEMDLQKWDRNDELVCCRSGLEQVAGAYESSHGIKYGAFRDVVQKSDLHKSNFATWSWSGSQPVFRKPLAFILYSCGYCSFFPELETLSDAGTVVDTRESL